MRQLGQHGQQHNRGGQLFNASPFANIELGVQSNILPDWTEALHTPPPAAHEADSWVSNCDDLSSSNVWSGALGQHHSDVFLDEVSSHPTLTGTVASLA